MTTAGTERQQFDYKEFGKHPRASALFCWEHINLWTFQTDVKLRIWVIIFGDQAAGPAVFGSMEAAEEVFTDLVESSDKMCARVAGEILDDAKQFPRCIVRAAKNYLAAVLAHA
jgi:hypothetical protein